MELKILTPEDKFLKVIDFNMDELKVALSDKLQKYKGLVYDDTQIATAKTDRATLNKFKKALDDKRIEIKKQLLEPYDSFETKIKEIITMVDAPVNEIDLQVKAFEEQQRVEKKANIEAYFTEQAEPIKDILTLDRAWDDKWLNISVKIKDIMKEIDVAIQAIITNMDIIKGFNSEFETQVSDIYVRTLDFSLAMKEKSRLEDEKAKFEERVKKEAERLERERVERIERERLEAERLERVRLEKERLEAERIEKLRLEAEEKAKVIIEPVKVVEAVKVEPVVAPILPQMKEVIITPQVVEIAEPVMEEVLEILDIRIFIKASQKSLLRAFMNDNDIKYGVVPKEV